MSKYNVNTVEIIRKEIFYTCGSFPKDTVSCAHWLIPNTDIQSTAVHRIVYSYSFLLAYKAQICYKLHKEVDMKAIKNINGVLQIWHYNRKVICLLFKGLDEAPKKMNIAISLWNVAGNFFLCVNFQHIVFYLSWSNSYFGGRAIT